ncbi:pre-mRNA-splicing factor 38B [Coniochaeta sp. 2T2.1]|nr:pre-mRNA-splicing factor 38B [Coniochaeta sp. 2T2.1]
MDTFLTDDHVAEMLAKEANDYSLRYSSLGLDAARSTRPSTKAKPNTRFLRNIIKETTNHNQALLAREAAESQARLESLAEAKAREERKHRPGAQDLRRRQLGMITAALQGGAKRKHAREEDGGAGAAPKRAAAELYKPGERSAPQDKSAITERPDRKLAVEQDKDGHRARHRVRESERRHREDRSLSPDGEDKSRKERRRDRSRSRSPRHREGTERHRHRHSHRYRERSLSDDGSATEGRSTSRRKHRSDRHRHRHRVRERDEKTDPSSSQRHHRHKSPEKEDTMPKQDDSDPLEAIIGPLPPRSPPQIRIKGRGAATGPSAMDSRFSDSYDPKSDIQPDSDVEGDDWADSLEALRDREKWRRQGAERLRAAGFSEEQIKGWEDKGGKEKGVEDVRWAKTGEGREWDRGKRVGGLDGADEDEVGEGDEMEGRLGWER